MKYAEAPLKIKTVALTSKYTQSLFITIPGGSKINHNAIITPSKSIDEKKYTSVVFKYVLTRLKENAVATITKAEKIFPRKETNILISSANITKEYTPPIVAANNILFIL